MPRIASLLLLALCGMYLSFLAAVQLSLVDNDGGNDGIVPVGVVAPDTGSVAVAVSQRVDPALVRSRKTTSVLSPFSSSSLGSGHDDNDGKNGKNGSGSGVRFVFVVGLEGTGHHLMRKLLNKSPAMDLVRTLDLRKPLKELQNSLFMARGLFNLHCGIKLPKEGPDVEGTVEEVVQKLRALAEPLENATAATSSGTPISISLNAFGSHFQMASYPQDNDSCRNLKYPNLDLLYDVCRRAGAECGHVYLYRNPTAVIKSTTINRKFNEGVGVIGALHLYNTMLNVIHSQLARHADRTLGCFGVLEPRVDQEEVWYRIRDLFGWNASDEKRSEFDALLAKTYDPPSTGDAAGSDEREQRQLRQHQNATIVPKNYRAYMQSLEGVHDDVVRLCREQVGRMHALASGVVESIKR